MTAIPSSMRALQLRVLGRLDEVELPVPAPAADEVLIRTAATTICTSDLADMRRNPFGIALPRVLGHEGAGVVAAAGEKVRDFRVGDRVTAHPVIPCLRCETCRRGLGHLCDAMGHLGSDRDGTFAAYFRIPARRARKVPAGMDMAVAALMEPVAVCLEAIARARVGAGDAVLVAGDGPFGIMISRLLTRCRPRAVVLVGRHPFRMNLAPQAVHLHERETADLPRAIRGATGGGADAAILAVASAAAVDMCIQSLRPRGRLSIFSALPDSPPVDLFRVHVKELELAGACNDENALDDALACLHDPSLRLEQMVTHRLPFAAWEQGIALASQGKDEAIKVAITFEEGKP